MWSRAELKARGKAAFKANYWRCVLVALILAIILGGSAGGAKNSYSKDNDVSAQELIAELRRLEPPVLPIVGAALGVFAATSMAVRLLLVNPLRVGCCNFFLHNSEQPASLGELKRSYQPEWMNNVVVMLLCDLFIVLWCCLLVIPGIIKALSYRLTPYIQAEHPEMKGTEAIRLSQDMMRGHKWDAFVFDLSFIGWYFLVAVTAGIASVFYVAPYKSAADAELYRAIRAEYERANGAF